MKDILETIRGVITLLLMFALCILLVSMFIAIIFRVWTIIWQFCGF